MFIQVQGECDAAVQYPPRQTHQCPGWGLVLDRVHHEKQRGRALEGPGPWADLVPVPQPGRPGLPPHRRPAHHTPLHRDLPLLLSEVLWQERQEKERVMDFKIWNVVKHRQFSGLPVESEARCVPTMSWMCICDPRSSTSDTTKTINVM